MLVVTLGVGSFTNVDLSESVEVFIPSIAQPSERVRQTA